MRENMGLFRGKRKDNGEWVEGYYKLHGFLLGTIEEEIYPTISEFGNCPISYRVDPDTVGECTGLKDKNGKLVFEGDILRIVERGMVADGGIVIFENGYPGGWLIKSPTSESKCSLSMRTDIEIIGTIHDNPELLKEGADNE